MKLIQVLDQAQILEEGIRFTNREIAKVKKNSKNILVAFEYEFVPNVGRMDRVRRDEPPKPSSEQEPEPREEQYLDYVYESQEYQDAESEISQTIFDEEFESRKEKNLSYNEDVFREGHEGAIETIDALLSKKRTFFHDDYPPVFRRVRDDLLGLDFSYKDLSQKIKEDITEDELTRLAGYIDIISQFKKTLKESFYIDLIVDSDPEALDDMYSELKNHLKYLNLHTPREFIEFFTDTINNYDDVKDFMEDLDNLSDMPTFSEFSDPFQSAFVFDTLKQELSGIVKELEDNDITFVNIRTTISFLEQLQLVDINDIDKDIVSYAEAKFGEEADIIREQTWDWVWNYGNASEGIDLEQIILNVQANHNVVILDIDDEPYYPPEGGDTSRGGSGTTPNAVKRFMIDYGSEWGLDFNRDFESEVDQEGYGMVEFKSHPVPLEAALDLMHKMFDFINDVGDTSGGHAGLHTNMSIKHIKFNKQYFNPLKLLMLVDNELIHDLFPVRGHVNDVFGHLDSTDVFSLAMLPGKSLTTGLKTLVRTGEKFQGINFQHMELGTDTRRVEFRYTGGKDYSERERLIRWTVYRFAYAMEAAFDDDFLEKEYNQEVVKFLDKRTKKLFPTFDKFTELSGFIKKNDIDSTDELFNYRVSNEMKFDWSVYKHQTTDLILFHVAGASWPIAVYDIEGNDFGAAQRGTLDNYDLITGFTNKTRMQVVKEIKRKRL